MISQLGINFCPILDDFRKKGCGVGLAVFGGRSNSGMECERGEDRFTVETANVEQLNNDGRIRSYEALFDGLKGYEAERERGDAQTHNDNSTQWRLELRLA
jgi:hypothetical protein